VTAAAGVGKSRLARGAVTAAQDAGALVEWVQATRSAAAVPLGAFAGVLATDARSEDPLELMQRSGEELRERAGSRPIVIGVDDAQLLDPVSAALVLHLTATAAAFVIATVRTGEPSPDAIVSLWKDAGAQRLELQHLDADDTATVVETVLGGPVDQGALGWVFDSSQGNALYVRELVLGAVDSGALAEAGGLWRLSAKPSMSRPLAELVAQRLDGLTPDERGVLELLALGEPLPVDEVATLADRDSLLSTEARGMTVVGGPAAGHTVRLAHPLYGEVLRDALPALRARDLRLRLAAVVTERRPVSSEDALRIARWLLDAGAPIATPLLVEAAGAANRAGDPDLGAQLAELAVADGAGIDAALLLARAHVLRRHFAEADAVLSEHEAQARASHDMAYAYLELRIVRVLFWGLNRPAEAQALFVRAQAWWPEARWQQRLDPIRLQPGGAVQALGATVDDSAALLADPGLDPVRRRELEAVHAVGLFYSGRTNEAYELGERLRPPVPLRDHSDALAQIMWCMIGMETGRDWVELDAWMSQAMRDGVRANDHQAAGVAALTIGGIRLIEGRYKDAARWFAEAELQLEHEDAFGSLLVTRALQAGVARFTGDPDGAVVAMKRSRATLVGQEPARTQLPYIARGEAWTASAQGDQARARTILLDAAAELSDIPVFAAQMNYEAIREGAPARSLVDALALLAKRCDSRLVAAYATHASALADDDGAALLRAAEELADIGTQRYAMEAAASAASSFLRAGRQDSARRAAARARELHLHDQGSPPPYIDGLDTDAIALTPREAQIAELASRGLSNAQIAERLVLSVRTVETYIYRATQKLGVNDRHDLRVP
jgi:DNA-binding NarL/FixJ family response regulator